MVDLQILLNVNNTVALFFLENFILQEKLTKPFFFQILTPTFCDVAYPLLVSFLVQMPPPQLWTVSLLTLTSSMFSPRS